MIRLVRPAEPDSLARHRAEWTARWTKGLQSGKRIEWATKAAKKALKAPLLAFSKGKCALCEGRLNATSFLEVEHYHAKTVRRELVFYWPNLFPACGICNRRKGELDHHGRLLKPDELDPEPLLWLHLGTGELQPHPDLAPEQADPVNETITAYDLNRGELCNLRFDKIEEVSRWLSRIDEGLGESRQCQDEWHAMTRPSAPWKFVLRFVLTFKGQAPLAEIDREAFSQ